MSYLQYWKLASAPFSSGYLFTEGSVAEAVARVGFLVSSHRRLGVLIGPPSVGKTVLLRNLLRQLPPSAGANCPRMVYQSLLGLTAVDLFKNLARRAGEGLIEMPPTNAFERRRSSSEFAWNAFQDVLYASAAAKTTIVLLLDDISFAQEAALAGLHRILEVNCPICCVLSVCSEKVESLPRNLRDRCQLRVDLPAWDLGQTADYFDFALAKAKGHPGIFEAQAITRIHELSDGLPQRINRLSELALLAGAARHAPRITSELADQVAEEFSSLQSHYSENIGT